MAFDLENVDNIEAIFLGRPAVNAHISKLINNNFYKCSLDEAIRICDHRDRVGYYGHPFRFGISAVKLRWLGAVYRVRTHAVVREIPSKMDGDYIFQIYGNRLRLEDWVPEPESVDNDWLI